MKDTLENNILTLLTEMMAKLNRLQLGEIYSFKVLAIYYLSVRRKVIPEGPIHQYQLSSG